MKMFNFKVGHPWFADQYYIDDETHNTTYYLTDNSACIDI